ncbi:MAG: hypothetical protein LBU02_00730 [Rickettsiales bacterium]|jgi:hypothetical protein|nr:hypothetical protein [Rickettsiales bacterium]
MSRKIFIVLGTGIIFSYADGMRKPKAAISSNNQSVIRMQSDNNMFHKSSLPVVSALRNERSVRIYLEKKVDQLQRDRRDALFTNRLVGLLMRVQSGVDYRENIDENDHAYETEMPSVTSLRGAESRGVFYGLSGNDWRIINRLISSCMHYLLGDGGLAANFEQIKKHIEKMSKILATASPKNDSLGKIDNRSATEATEMKQLSTLINEAEKIVSEYKSEMPPDA